MESLHLKKKSITAELPKGPAWGTRVAAVVILILLTAGLSFADGKKHKLSKDVEDLKSGPSATTVDVIIQFNQAPTQAHHQKVQDKGGVLKTKLDFINGAHYSVPVEALDALADDPDVVYISPDRPVRGALDTTVATVNGGYAQTLGLNGAGVGVAVIDCGVSDIPDLHNASGAYEVVYSQSFVPNDTNTGDPFGHGTHVSGIIASSGASSTGANYYRHFVGLSPGVNLVNLRVLDHYGMSTDSVVIAAIATAIKLQKSYNIGVMNLSLGRAVYETASLDPLCQAVEQAWKAGITVVVAAGNYGRLNTYGNNGYGTITAPGNDPYVITVGAMTTMGTPSRTDDVITTYSSKGPTSYDNYVKPDIVAPGNRVVSLYQPGSALSALLPKNPAVIDYYKSCNSTLLSNAYFTLSGTSMASPVVSGAAALLLQQSRLTPDQVKARLMKTASKTFPSSSSITDPATGITYYEQYDIFTIGAGYLDVQAALMNTDVAIASALSPKAAYNTTTGQVDIVYGTSVVWGTAVVWVTSLVWGNSVVWGSSIQLNSNGTEVNGTAVLWGNSVVWGQSGTTAFSIVWGSSVVWGSAGLLNTLAANVEAMNITANGDTQ